MKLLGRIADFRYNYINKGPPYESLKPHKHGFVYIPCAIHPLYRDKALVEFTKDGFKIVQPDSEDYLKHERKIYRHTIFKFYENLYEKQTWYFVNIDLYKVEFHLRIRSEPGSFLIVLKRSPHEYGIYLHYLDSKQNMTSVRIYFKYEEKRNCRVYKFFNTSGWHESLFDLIEYAQQKKRKPLEIQLTNGVRPYGTSL